MAGPHHSLQHEAAGVTALTAWKVSQAHAAEWTGKDAAAVRRRIEALETMLERALMIPGTRIPVGLDAMIGLVPVVGDALAGIIGLYLVWEARNLGLSKWAVARMLGNVGIDTAIGAIPLAGDIFDVLYRSNSKNLRILKQHLDRHHPSTAVVDVRPL
jgi:hypothetical protein